GELDSIREQAVEHLGEAHAIAAYPHRVLGDVDGEGEAALLRLPEAILDRDPRHLAHVHPLICDRELPAHDLGYLEKAVDEPRHVRGLALEHALDALVLGVAL